MALLDITVPLSATTPVYSSDPTFRLERIALMERGDALNLSRVELGVHTGTHLDAPRHFLPDGRTVDQIDLEPLVGPAQVLDLVSAPGPITAADLEGAGLEHGVERVLCRTRGSWLWERPGFQPEFPALTPDAAEWLVWRKVRLVGIDYLSIEPFGAEPAVVHRLLLEAGIVIVEGLDLRLAAPGHYILYCLPLKLDGAEGAPCRALLAS